MFSLIPLLPPPNIPGAMRIISLSPTANQTARDKTPTQTDETDWTDTTSSFLQSLTVTPGNPGCGSTAQQCNQCWSRITPVTRATDNVFKFCFTFHWSVSSTHEYVSSTVTNGWIAPDTGLGEWKGRKERLHAIIFLTF